MKKYENPEINISLFDINVATTDSAMTKATEALNGVEGLTKVDSAQWGTDDWKITF